MRKSRGKYKVLGRLGYNAIMRRWSGNKKKWENHVMYGKLQEESGSEKSHVRNPIVALKNQDRITNVKDPHAKIADGKQIRRKDIHGIKLNQKTGRKMLYGGVTGDRIRKGRLKERKGYKKRKREEDRKYRKGRLISEKESVMEYSKENPTSDQFEKEEKKKRKQQQPSHRISNTERRADLRRWRSGRIPTLQIARDLIEHGYVSGVDEEGKRRDPVKWSGRVLRVGTGRKVNEKVWENIKGRSTNLIQKKEYHMVAARYREVDYVTGRRMIIRKPESGEIAIPMGRKVSMWTYL